MCICFEGIRRPKGIFIKVLFDEFPEGTEQFDDYKCCHLACLIDLLSDERLQIKSNRIVAEAVSKVPRHLVFHVF